jgi:uncharacterized RDD family membrane protein YckC
MTDTTAPNPFAPPRAHVEDHTAVATEMVTATRLSRFLALLIDAAPGFLFAIMFLALMPGLLTGKFDPSKMDVMSFGVMVLVCVVVSFGWVIWLITLLYRYGQTIGKKFLGIRVVRMDGGRVTFARFFFLRGAVLAIARAIVGGIALALHIKYGNFAGYLVTLVDALLIFGTASRCLHDLVADTRVVTAESSPNATLEGSRGH